MKRIVRMTVAAAVLSMSVVLSAQAPALDIRLGYWEMSTTVTMGGTPPTMDTSKMTAAQKAKMEAALKEMLGPHTDVTKDCITSADLKDKALLLGQDSDDCTQTITANTKTLLEGNVACKSDDGAMKGHTRIEATSPTAFKVLMEGTNTSDDKVMTMSMSMSAKFISATCPKE